MPGLVPSPGLAEELSSQHFTEDAVKSVDCRINLHAVSLPVTLALQEGGTLKNVSAVALFIQEQALIST